MLLPFENQTCQSTRHIGPGVDIDPIGKTSGLVGSGVAMNDAFAEVHFASEKLLSDPQQILWRFDVQGECLAEHPRDT